MAVTKLEDVKNGSRVAGIVAGQAVEIVSVEWIGEQAINVVYREPGAGIAEATLYRDNEPQLTVEQRGRMWSFDADGGLLRLVTAKPSPLATQIHNHRHKRQSEPYRHLNG